MVALADCEALTEILHLDKTNKHITNMLDNTGNEHCAYGNIMSLYRDYENKQNKKRKCKSMNVMDRFLTKRKKDNIDDV